MTDSAPHFTAAEQAILPLLPMIYVAWADGELSDDELSVLRAQLPGDVPALDAWLDPAAPPSAEQLQQLLRRLKAAAGQLDTSDRRSLAALGQQIAQQTPGASRWSEPSGIAALAAVEQALGLYASEASAVFFPPTPSTVDAPPPVALPIDVLKVLLDGPHAAARQRVREVLSDPLFRYAGENTSAAHRERVYTWCIELARRGLTDPLLPASRGEAPDLGAFVATFETLACFDLSLLVKFGVQFGLFGCSVLFLGSEAQKRAILPAALSMELPGCFAMTERGHGSNVRGLRTTATYDRDADGFIIDTPHTTAGKEWIGNAATHGQMATVFAQLRVGEDDHGVHAFLVPIRRPDGSPMPQVRIADCGHKMGLNGVDNGRLWFDRVLIPRDGLLSRFASVDAEGRYHSPIASPSRRFFTMLGALVGGRISVAAASVTVAKSALTIAIRYSARRRQFGPEGGPEARILDYPTQQQRLLPRLATTYALHFAIASLTAEYTAAIRDGGEMREIEAQAAGLKAAASRHCTETVQAARESCGGQGYASINRFADLKADSDVFTTFEGDNTVLLQLVAKAVLGRFRSQFSDPNPLAIVRHVAQLAASTLSEKNPLRKRWAASVHLRDGAFHRDIFAGREQDRALELALGIKRTLDQGTEPFEAFNRWQLRLVALAEAHVERLVHDRFRDVVEACADPVLQATLNDLCDLYALSRISADRAWFIENGYLVTGKSEAVCAEVEELCGELVGRAEALVEAFSIPDTALAAPIAL
ncbi:MAG: acyl-CoA oxidase [Myxococcota bacterium]|jgi:acyl-CoA oxidase